MSTIKKNNLINLVLLGIIVFNLAGTVIKEKDRYLSFDYWKRFDRLKYIYENSQYRSKTPKVGWIADEFVFSYAGGVLIKGGNPILINSETPPLGKYLIGLSAAITGNENIIIIISAFFSLFFMYFLGLQIFTNKTLALVPPMLFSFEPIFKNQLIYVPLLDIMQIPFMLASFYFFNKGIHAEKKKKYLYFILSSFMIGGFISIKFFITGFTIIAAFYLTLIFQKNSKSILPITISIPFSLLVLVINYFKVFIEGYTLRQFFGIQKWIFLYHQSKLILPFTIWPLIYFNKWYVWYGDKPIISDGQWTIMWPVIQTISLLTIILYVLNKIQRRREIEIVMIWSILYILFVSFGNASSRYLVIYIPILYIVSLYGLIKIGKKLLQKLKTPENYGTIKT